MVTSGMRDPGAGLMGKQVTGGHNGARSSMVRCPEHHQNTSEPGHTHTIFPTGLSPPDVKRLLSTVGQNLESNSCIYSVDANLFTPLQLGSRHSRDCSERSKSELGTRGASSYRELLVPLLFSWCKQARLKPLELRWFTPAL